MASKYHTPPPNVDDGSDLIYRALASFGDNIAAAIRERRERSRREEDKKKDDTRQAAQDATHGLFKRGAVPENVVAQDSSVRAAMANLGAMGAPNAGKAKPMDFAQAGVTHPHQTRQLPGTDYMYAPFVSESHQDDDRREVDDYRDVLNKLETERTRDPKFTYSGPQNATAIRSALAVQEGKRAREKDEREVEAEKRRTEDQQIQRNTQDRMARTESRVATMQAESLRRQRDDDERKKRVGALTFSASLIKDPARRAAQVATWLTQNDTRLGISPSHVEDELAKLHGARAAGQTATADPAKRAKQVWDQAVGAGTMNKQAKKRGMPINPTEAVQSYHSVVRPTLNEDEREAMDAEIARIAKETLDAQKRTAPKKK
jgi:hypothetical protein